MTTPRNVLRETIPMWSARGTDIGQEDVVESGTPSLDVYFTVTAGATVVRIPSVVPTVIPSPIGSTNLFDELQIAMERIEQLESQVNQERQRIIALEERVETLESQISNEDVIVLRTITREQAKEEILEAFQSGEPLDQADLAERLSLSLSLVAEICDELIQEGRVEYYADNRN